MNEYDKRLDFDSDTFEGMKHDMNFVLQRLLGNMIEKQSTEGSMTIKIDVTMVKEFIPNYDPNVKGESREISKPQFKHKGNVSGQDQRREEREPQQRDGDGYGRRDRLLCVTADCEHPAENYL